MQGIERNTANGSNEMTITTETIFSAMYCFRCRGTSPAMKKNESFFCLPLFADSF